MYDPQEGVKVYGTSHLGLHSDNYWILGDEVTTYFVVFSYTPVSLPNTLASCDLNMLCCRERHSNILFWKKETIL